MEQLEIKKGDRVKKIAMNPKTGIPEEIVGTIVYTNEDSSIVEVDEDNNILFRFYGAMCRKIRVNNELLKPATR